MNREAMRISFENILGYSMIPGQEQRLRIECLWMIEQLHHVVQECLKKEHEDAND